jgi:hypothetical protein
METLTGQNSCRKLSLRDQKITYKARFSYIRFRQQQGRKQSFPALLLIALGLCAGSGRRSFLGQGRGRDPDRRKKLAIELSVHPTKWPSKASEDGLGVTADGR